MDELLQGVDIKGKRETVVFRDLSPQIITQILVERFKKSSQLKDMITAEHYFDGHNETIERKARVFYDKDGKSHDNPAASNAKIKNNFFRKFVQQKQDYALGKTFILKISDENENEIDMSSNEYGKVWKQLCDEQLFKLSYDLAGDAAKYGIGWTYIWVNEKSELEFIDVPPTLIYPSWQNRQHTKLDKLVYNYVVEEYENLSPVLREFAEYWSENERILFDVDHSYSEVKDKEYQTHAHLFDGDIEKSWERIPFVWFKGTKDEKSILSFVKEQIDSYDELDSMSVDQLKDDIDKLLIVKGVSPDYHDITEAKEIAKMTKMMVLDTDGDANFIGTSFDVQNYLVRLQALKREITQFGYGVDFEDERFGGNPNQLVIKSLYQDLDTYTDGLERQFQEFVDNLKYFVDKWWEFTGKGSFEECRKYKILVKFDRSMMMNQTEQIQNTVSLAGTGVSKKTMLEYNPVVQDVDVELERIKEEQVEATTDELFKMAQQSSIQNGEGYETPEIEENKEKEGEQK